MKKQEYFEELLTYLPQISSEDREQIYTYYDELICDGMEAGHTEEEMLAQFGSPKQLAQRLQEEWDLQSVPALSPVPAKICGKELVCSFLPDINRIPYAQIVTDCCRIRIVPTENSQLTISYPKFLEQYAACSESPKGIFFSLKRHRSAFSLFGRRSGNILVEIPKGFLTHLRVHSRNVGITMEDQVIEKVNLSTSNASIRVVSLAGKELELSSSNASLTVENSAFVSGTACTSNGSIRVMNTIAKTLEGQTGNASITFSNVKCEEQTLITSNGRITIDSGQCGTCVCTTSNGSISVEQLKGNDLTFTSSNGSIRGTLIGKAEDYSISCHTSNGSCSPAAVSRPDAENQLYAKTSNASIRLDFIC